MRDMGRVEGSEAQAKPLVVGKDTVYIHTNIEYIGDDMYEYDEIQYDLWDFIQIIAEDIDEYKNKEFEIQKSSTHIQWKCSGDITWNNIIALSDLKGEQGVQGINGSNGTDGTDGQEIELQNNETYIRWRYVNGEWNNLISIQDLISGVNLTIDSEMSSSSSDAVQNKIIKAYVDGLVGDIESLLADM